MKECKVILKTTGGGMDNELLSVGKTFVEDGKRHIIFDGEEDGAVYTTEIVIFDGKIEVKKSGELATFICFEEGKSYTTFVNTPYGNFTMIINSKKVDVALKGDDADIALEYESFSGDAGDKFNLDIKCRAII